MSSETYYSPELTISKAAQIVRECEEIINRVAAQTKSIMRISGVEITNATPELIESKHVWENVEGMVSQGKASTEVEALQIAIKKKGKMIDDSDLLHHDTKNIEKMLVECMPRTVEERKEKEKLLELYYRENDTKDVLLRISKFCESQLIISDAQNEIIVMYKVLTELLGKKRGALSIEEMTFEIEKMRAEYEEKKKQKYIQDTIREVFQMFGYDFSHVTEIAKDGRVECKVDGIKNAKCYVTYTDEGFLFESVGVIRHGRTASNNEKKQMLSDEHKICTLNSQIENELERRGIVCMKVYDVEPSIEHLRVEEMSGSTQTRYLSSNENKGIQE